MIQKFAHVKWFNTTEPIPEPAFNIAELLVVAAIVIAGLLVLKFIDTWLKRHKITSTVDKKLKPFRSWVPLIVRLSTAAFLVLNFGQDLLLAPNVTTSNSTTSNIISGVFILAAVLIGLGLFTKVGVAALLAGYMLIFTQTDIVDVFDHFEYVAIAGYLWLRGPGKYSLDSYMKQGKLSMPASRQYSLDVYRIGVGIGLSVLALSEKIFNVTAAQDFLNQYDWNLLSVVDISDRHFILIAGSVELLVGIGLILNFAPRVLVSVVLSLMIVTAILLGVEEIYGHLFAVGIVAAVWVNDRKPLKNS